MSAIKEIWRSNRRSMCGAVLALAFATGGGPAHAATSTITNIDGPVDWTVEDPCTGETVQLSGVSHVVVHRLVENDGTVRTTVHQNLAEVRGVGLTTGTSYRVHSNVTGIDVQPVDALLTYVTNFSLTSQGDAVNTIFHQTVQIRLQEGGGQILRVENIFAKCQ